MGTMKNKNKERFVMLPNPKKYLIWPVTPPADRPTDMVVVPAERAFLLFEGEEYVLNIIAVNGDETSYHEPTGHCKVKAVAHDGVLHFCYTFKEEGEYVVQLFYQEKKLQVMHLYALREDLFGLMPLRGDFHGHSYRSDGIQDPAALAGHYREQGYDFFSLTDHNRFYPGGEIDEAFAGVKLGIARVTGEEIHAPGSVVHIVHVGGKASVADRYIKDRENFDKTIAEKYLPAVPADLPVKYHDRYAKAMWAVDAIHEEGGIAIFPHPYWRPGKSACYNVCDEFTLWLLRSGRFDAFELIGGMGQVGNNRAVALWSELRAEGLTLPVVGSSDVHGLYKAGEFPHRFTVAFAAKNENDALIAAVKDRMTVAVEATGAEYDREYRCYGPMRLVSYASFLLVHYFPLLQRICQGEGMAMRAYLMGGVAPAVIEDQAALTAQLQDCFFGRKMPKLPDDHIRAFEEKWRGIHCDGPVGKGTVYDSTDFPRQI